MAKEKTSESQSAATVFLNAVTKEFNSDKFEKLTECISFNDYLNSGDAVASATVAIESITGDASPLALPTDAATDVVVASNVVNIRLNAGTSGNVYNVDVTITTTAGDTDVRRFRIVVGEKHL